MCKNRRERGKAISSAVVLAIGLITTGSPRRAVAQYWNNPNGGSWTNPVNWNNDVVPTGPAYFTLGSPAGYTVTNVTSFAAITVQADQTTLNFGGYSYDAFSPSVPATVTSTAGQTSSLTLLNGTIENDDQLAANVYGTGGTCNLTLNNFSLISSAGVTIGGQSGSITNYNQVGGVLAAENVTGSITFGQSSGLVNVSISRASLASQNDDLNFGAAGTVIATVSSSQINLGPNSVSLNIGLTSGNATVTAMSTPIAAGCITVGSVPGDVFNADGIAGLPKTGGGVGALTLTNSLANLSSGILVGVADGNGTLIASGTASKLHTTNYFVVGDQGTGAVALSGGATMDLNGNNYIGGSGGNGKLTLSGAGTSCTIGGNSGADQGILNIGINGVANGVGLVELDHTATLTANSYNLNAVPAPGIITLGGQAMLEVLSGSRVITTQLTEVQGSILEVGLDGPSVISNGQIDVTSLATFAGTLDIVFENGFQPAVGEQFQLFLLGGETGQFTAVNAPPGYVLDTSSLYGNGMITVTAVPEPVATAGVGLIVMALLGRRRAKVGRTNWREL